MSSVLSVNPVSLKLKLFLHKGDYETCHIQLNDTQERVAAIAIGEAVYSFFRTLRDREKALDLLGKLYDAGNDAVITESPKSYAVWVLEEDATRLTSPKTSNEPQDMLPVAV